MAPPPPPACSALPDILFRAEAAPGARAFEIEPHACQSANGGAPASGTRAAAHLDAQCADFQAGDGCAIPDQGAAQEHILPRRAAFEWRAVMGPSDAGQAGARLSRATSGTLTLLGVDVGYVFKCAITQVTKTGVTGRLCTAGIDAGRGTVNAASTAAFDRDMALMLDFSEPVEAIQFRINHLGTQDSFVKARAFDADGHPLPVEFDEGASVTGGDGAALSVLVTIPGPVSNLQVEYAGTGSDAASITDIWFDDPATGYGEPRNAFVDDLADAGVIASSTGVAAIVVAQDGAAALSGVDAPGTPANDNTPPSTMRTGRTARDTIH